MTAKTWTYVLYLLITVPLTVAVARTLHRNGKVFLHDVFRGNDDLAAAVNHLLVVGFYLLNLGYVALFLKTSREVSGAEQVLEALSNRVGIVALVLGCVHLGNVWVFISILTDPTMGGVSASFAFVGDVVMAEPKALIGFAGPRVIEQTVRETLPEGFQRSEFLLEKGAIDMIVDRRQLRDQVARVLALLQKLPAVA